MIFRKNIQGTVMFLQDFPDGFDADSDGSICPFGRNKFFAAAAQSAIISIFYGNHPHITIFFCIQSNLFFIARSLSGTGFDGIFQ